MLAKRESHHGCPIPLYSLAAADVRHVTGTLCQTVQIVAILQASSPHHRQGGEDNDRYKENLKNFNFQMHFLMFIMIVTILLINLLIAMMGNTYGSQTV